MSLPLLCAITLLVLCAGAGATALAPWVFPLWFLEIGQEHGRFAGLGSDNADPVPTRGKMIGPSGFSALQHPQGRLFPA